MPLTEEQEERLSLLLSELEANRKSLSDWERGFLDDQSKRFDQYGAKVFMSPKQFAVLERMYEKVTDVK